MISCSTGSTVIIGGSWLSMFGYILNVWWLWQFSLVAVIIASAIAVVQEIILSQTPKSKIMENEEQITPSELTRYTIDLPRVSGSEGLTKSRISYGWDPDEIGEPARTGYYIMISDVYLGNTMLSKGYSDILTGNEMLSLIESKIAGMASNEQIELFEKHKLLIAAGLPF